MRMRNPVQLQEEEKEEEEDKVRSLPQAGSTFASIHNNFTLTISDKIKP